MLLSYSEVGAEEQLTQYRHPNHPIDTHPPRTHHVPRCSVLAAHPQPLRVYDCVHRVYSHLHCHLYIHEYHVSQTQLVELPT